MKTLKLLCAAAAAVTMTFTAQAEKTAKAVLLNENKILYFVYDDVDYDAQGVDWFSVAEAEAIDPDCEDVPWYDCNATVTKVVFSSSFADYKPTQFGSWFYQFDRLASVEGLEHLDTSSATGMTYMFHGCSSLTSLDVTAFSSSASPSRARP